jgi:hypothetical protein
LYYNDWTISFRGVLARASIVYYSIVSLQRCSFIQI